MTSSRVQARAAEFRRACRAVRIPLLDRARYWVNYVGLAHRGTQVHSATHDSVYADGRWARGYDRARARIERRLAASATGDPPLDVPSFGPDELEVDDVRALMKAQVPFVLKDGARGLPVRDWTMESLEEAVGDCEVPINAADDRPSDDTSRPTKASRYYEFRRGPLREVTASIRAGGNLRLTTAEDVMHHDGGRLRGELGIERWEELSGWSDHKHHWLRKRLFVGKVFSAQMLLQPEGAFTLWHAEPGDSYFVLAKGVKTWWLAHPDYTAAMQPRVKTTTNYAGSNIDVREPDEVQRSRGFHGYLGVPKCRVRLEPGDVLRVPNHWWHTVVTEPEGYTIAATVRLSPSPNLDGLGYVFLRRFDGQYRAIVDAFIRDGRITDAHIGAPRPPRTAV